MRIVQVTSTVLRSYEYPRGGWVLVREGVSLGELFSRGRAAAEPGVAESRP